MITTLHLAGLLALIAAILIAPVACQEERLERLEEVTRLLSRQLMLQQLYVDEKSRSDGDSGIKQVCVFAECCVGLITLVCVFVG